MKLDHQDSSPRVGTLKTQFYRFISAFCLPYVPSPAEASLIIQQDGHGPMKLGPKDASPGCNVGITGSATSTKKAQNSPPRANNNPSPSAPTQPAPSYYAFKAQALYPYTASPDEPTDISFAQGEILDIVDGSDDWWHARKEDGTTGTVPSNFLLPLGVGNGAAGSCVFKARALYAYTGDPDQSDISFNEGEILDIVDNKNEWWLARKEDGTIGTAPSNFLQPLTTLHFGNDPKAKSNHVYEARALYAYTTNPEKPMEISFAKDEALYIVDVSEEWWEARKEDGTTAWVLWLIYY